MTPDRSIPDPPPDSSVKHSLDSFAERPAHRSADPSPDPQPPGRRPRYPGTHPRRFQQKYKEQRPDLHPEMTAHVRAQGRTPAGSHVPIMVAEILDVLSPRPGQVVVDCTLGHGGHAEALLGQIEPDGTLLGLDVDGRQLSLTGKRLEALGGTARILLHRGNFAGMDKALRTHGLEGCDLLLADLGVSSMQVDDPSRGFSYKWDGPLDMRMDDRRSRTAADLLAALPEAELAAALAGLADESDAVALARAIVAARERAPLVRTLELAHLILRAKGWTPKSWRDHKHEHPRELHPAARTFQAFRILVNDELGALEQLLRVLPWMMRPGGRMAMLSFHSGEHQRIQDALAEGGRQGCYTEFSHEPPRPSPEEIRDNPRSAAARLHWAHRA